MRPNLELKSWPKQLSDLYLGPGKLTAPLSAFHNVLSATFRFQ